jgi:hypothetical protein
MMNKKFYDIGTWWKSHKTFFSVTDAAAKKHEYFTLKYLSG